MTKTKTKDWRGIVTVWRAEATTLLALFSLTAASCAPEDELAHQDAEGLEVIETSSAAVIATRVVGTVVCRAPDVTDGVLCSGGCNQPVQNVALTLWSPGALTVGSIAMGRVTTDASGRFLLDVPVE